jgi:hypothetical protein
MSITVGPLLRRSAVGVVTVAVAAAIGSGAAAVAPTRPAQASRTAAAVTSAPVDVSPVKVAIVSYTGVGDRETWGVFGRGTDGQVWWRSVVPGTAQPETPWRAVPGVVGSGPDALQTYTGTILLAARSTGGSLVTREITRTSNGSGWVGLGGALTSAPVLAAAADGTVGVFARGADGAVWYRLRPYGGSWGSWRSLGGRLTSAPDAYAGDNYFLVEGRGTDGALWGESVSTAGASGGGWRSNGFYLTSASSGFPFDDAVAAIYYRGDRGQLIQRMNSPQSLGGALTSAPDAAPLLERSVGVVVVRGTDNAIWLWDGAWHGLGGQVS